MFIRTTAARALPVAAAAILGAGTLAGTVERPLIPRVALCEKKASFLKATCTKSEPHTHDTKLITFKLDSNKSWNDGGPVANVVIRTEVETKGENAEKKMLARPYNPLSSNSDKFVTLLVKRYGEDAQMGSALHQIHPGESVELKGPNRQWTMPEKGSIDVYYMIAGGTGITPIHQAAEGILTHDDQARVVLLTLNKTEGDVLLKNELENLQKKTGDRLKVVHLTGQDDVHAAVSKVLPQASSWASAKVPVKVMVCGRAQMTAAIAGPKTKDYKQGEVGGVLKAMGYATEQVWKF